MTEENKTKPKLTLSGSKLSLKKPMDSEQIKKNYLSKLGGSNSIQIKKNISLNKAPSNFVESDPSQQEEMSKRLSLIKRASESDRNKNNNADKQQMIGTLADFVNTEPDQQDTTAPSLNKVDKTSKKNVPSKDGFVKSAIPSKGDESNDAKNAALKISHKPKLETPRKLNKSDIIHMLDTDATPHHSRERSLAAIKRSREKEKRKLQSSDPKEKLYREVTIPETITVGELSNRMSERGADVIRELMKLGIIANANQTIDADTAELVTTTLGHTVKRVYESDVENILDNNIVDEEENLKHKAPVVTVMGHVDHGKTSLLDALKSTDVAASEAGGITQHIGAYRINLANNAAITFIDTPGHAAFTAMRMRGANATDIVILVIAADDGIKEQTKEAINHAKAAKVPIIVAVNKIDKPGADIERVKNELLSHDLVPEEYGGDIVVVPISAKNRQNLDKLEEAILLVAEMLALKANPDANASGLVIESNMSKNKGIVTTVLVQRGTLNVGDIVVAGEVYGKVKTLHNDRDQILNSAGPSVPVEILGLSESPAAGDSFNVVTSEKQARDIADYRKRKNKEKKVSVTTRSSLEDLFSKASGNSNVIQDLPIIVKADVQGSVEAIVTSIDKLTHEKIRPQVIHYASSPINESDVTLSQATGALILGFNVRANNQASLMADNSGVDIRYYSIIYNLLDDVKEIMSGMLEPIIREEYIGSVDIRQVINITKVGKIAGSYVTRGNISLGAKARLIRDDVVVHEGKIKTLKRFKDDVKDVREGYECGIAFEQYSDMKEGDKVEVFALIEEKQKL